MSLPPSLHVPHCHVLHMCPIVVHLTAACTMLLPPCSCMLHVTIPLHLHSYIATPLAAAHPMSLCALQLHSHITASLQLHSYITAFLQLHTPHYCCLHMLPPSQLHMPHHHVPCSMAMSLPPSQPHTSPPLSHLHGPCHSIHYVAAPIAATHAMLLHALLLHGPYCPPHSHIHCVAMHLIIA